MHSQGMFAKEKQDSEEISQKAEKKKPILNNSKENCVTLRVWFAGLGKNVGHVSLATRDDGDGRADKDGIYASFFPKGGTKVYGKLHPSGVEGALNTLEIDLTRADIGEGRLPDLVITLRSLNVAAIEADFKKFEISDCKWSVWGSHSAAFKKKKDSSENIRNCSGLVAYLLKIGGIEKLLPGIFSKIVIEAEASEMDGGRLGDAITDAIGFVGARVLGGLNILITPDGIGEAAKHAEEVEKECYEFDPPLTVNVDVNVHVHSSKKCLMM
jgi:hypothetical protein